MNPGRHAPPSGSAADGAPNSPGPTTGSPNGLDATPDPGAGPDRLVVGELVIDLRGREARLAGAAVPFTRIEFDLVAYLAAHPGWVVSPDQLMEEIWGYRSMGDTRAVAVHIGNARRKLGDKVRRTPVHPDGPRRRIQTGQP